MRRIISLAALATALLLAACGEKSDPMSSMDAAEAPEPAARTRSNAVAATAENRLGLTPDGPTTFTVTIANISEAPAYTASGVFNTPAGATGPGPIFEGDAYEFSFHANDGARLSFALMYVQSNDLFLAPAPEGLELFPGSVAVDGSVTGQIMLWDAGTEVNEEPGVGANQAPRQSGANTGADEAGPVEPVDDGFTYPAIGDLVDVTITSSPDAGSTLFSVRVENVSSLTPMAPGVFVVHDAGEPLFTSGASDRGDGLEALAEDGSPGELAAALDSDSGTITILAPGAWALHAGLANPLFTSGSTDAGEGLEALAEDGSPGDLAAAVALKSGVIASGAFNTPVGAAAPGVVTPGGAYSFQVTARPGDRLTFATMFVQSNDLFLAPSHAGMGLFRGGRARSGDVTAYMRLWDAGTEVNQAPGLGADQAPRQSGPDTGDSEGGTVRLVDDGFDYATVSGMVRVSVTPL